MIKVGGVALGLVLLLVVVVLVAGARAPRRHVARVSVVLRRQAGEVWAVVSDLGAWASWNTSVKSVRRLADRDGHAVWAVESGGQVLPSEIVEATPPGQGQGGARLVTRIADDQLPFGGTWTWEIEPSTDGSSTRVTITEDGFVKSVVFRGVGSLFLGYTRTQSAYLAALGARFGDPRPELEQSVRYEREP
jgi:hypothetical protein